MLPNNVLYSDVKPNVMYINSKYKSIYIHTNHFRHIHTRFCICCSDVSFSPHEGNKKFLSLFALGWANHAVYFSTSMYWKLK